MITTWQNQNGGSGQEQTTHQSNEGLMYGTSKEGYTNPMHHPNSSDSVGVGVYAAPQQYSSALSSSSLLLNSHSNSNSHGSSSDRSMYTAPLSLNSQTLNANANSTSTSTSNHFVDSLFSAQSNAHFGSGRSSDQGVAGLPPNTQSHSSNPQSIAQSHSIQSLPAFALPNQSSANSPHLPQSQMYSQQQQHQQQQHQYGYSQHLPLHQQQLPFPQLQTFPSLDQQLPPLPQQQHQQQQQQHMVHQQQQQQFQQYQIHPDSSILPLPHTHQSHHYASPPPPQSGLSSSTSTSASISTTSTSTIPTTTATKPFRPSTSTTPDDALHKHSDSTIQKDPRPRHFLCATCHKSFLRKQDLSRHEVTHTTIKAFSCPLGCGTTFGRADAMSRHVKARRCSN
ncbi:hypothetical protein HDU79_008048 [Rhizoclosmatium sp. JEL0117]|nr:hypothetical protein HDU79_008048 [Rhizoclosmatium sp. JEL0117]